MDFLAEGGKEVNVESAIARWLARLWIIHKLKALGLKRAERKRIMAFLQQLLTLNFAGLKGWRTAIGLLTYFAPGAVDAVVGSPVCTGSSAVCALLHAASAWFLAMGIRGKS